MQKILSIEQELESIAEQQKISSYVTWALIVIGVVVIILMRNK